MSQGRLRQLREQHPAWGLLSSHTAPWVIAVLYATFVEPNRVAVPEDELLQTIEDYLFRLREEPEVFDDNSEDPGKPASYLLALLVC